MFFICGYSQQKTHTQEMMAMFFLHNMFSLSRDNESIATMGKILKIRHRLGWGHMMQ